MTTTFVGEAIATGSDDGTLQIFSCIKEEQASDDKLEAYECELTRWKKKKSP